VDRDYIFTETDGLSMAGWGLSWMLKAVKDEDDSSALITKTQAVMTVLLAVATVTIADTDTDSLDAGVYYWELKRTDPGAESVLGYGTFTLVRGVHHE
jgi:hypothetical protein